MILGAMLLTLRKIALTQQRDIVVHRNHTIGQHDDGVKVSNPTSEFELWLSGKTDYVVIEKAVNTRKPESQIPSFQVMNYFAFLSSLGQP
jgi:hypothetical protein